MHVERAAASSEHSLAPVAVRTVGSSERVALVSLRGEFDIETVPQIDAGLRRALGPFFHDRHLIVDLNGATLVDSSFIAYLVRLIGDVRSEGREVVLARPRGHVRRTLLIVGVPNVVPVYDSLDAALDAALANDVPIIPPALPCRPPADA